MDLAGQASCSCAPRSAFQSSLPNSFISPYSRGTWIPPLAHTPHFKPSAHTTGYLPPDVLIFKAIQILQNLTACAMYALRAWDRKQPSHLIFSVPYRFHGPGLSQDGLGLTSVFFFLLFSHWFPNPCSLVSIPDPFLKSYSHSCLYCLLNFQRLPEVTDCFIFDCIPNTECSTCLIRSAQYMLVKRGPACMDKPSDTAVTNSISCRCK